MEYEDIIATVIKLLSKVPPKDWKFNNTVSFSSQNFYHADTDTMIYYVIHGKMSIMIGTKIEIDVARPEIALIYPYLVQIFECHNPEVFRNKKLQEWKDSIDKL